MWWRRLGVGLALSAGLLLGGCAADPEAAPDEASTDGATADPSAEAVPEAGETTPPSGPGLAGPGLADPVPADPPTGRDPLADLAEGAAGAQPRSSFAPGEQVLGGDISWPNCPTGLGIPERPTLGLPMPLETARYVVVGLTNGPGFTPNPCLAAQVAWVKERRLMLSAYAVVSYPHRGQLEQHGDDGPYDGSTRLGALRNVGYAQATFNIASMRSAGFITPFVWIDVETVKDFDWIADTVENAAVIEGTARGYTDAGYGIGVYSTPYLWQRIAGGLSLDNAPEWRAAGPTSQAEALRRCGDDWRIQGGPAVLGQWVDAQRDLNVTCPGAETQLARYFHQF